MNLGKLEDTDNLIAQKDAEVGTGLGDGESSPCQLTGCQLFYRWQHNYDESSQFITMFYKIFNNHLIS